MNTEHYAPPQALLAVSGEIMRKDGQRLTLNEAINLGAIRYETELQHKLRTSVLKPRKRIRLVAGTDTLHHALLDVRDELNRME